MTFGETVRALLTRWYIAVPGLLLSLALAGVTFVLFHHSTRPAELRCWYSRG